MGLAPLTRLLIVFVPHDGQKGLVCGGDDSEVTAEQKGRDFFCLGWVKRADKPKLDHLKPHEHT